MDHSEFIQSIKTAIEDNNIVLARELLRDVLQSPNADLYFQASRVALDMQQKRWFLEKALELDPFHLESANELAQTSQNRSLAGDASPNHVSSSSSDPKLPSLVSAPKKPGRG